MGSTGVEVYDFIIVGAGPAGCTTAWRLAHSKKKPSVLLIESGGKNESKELRVDGDRWISSFNPELGRGYMTVPQKQLDDKVIIYERGKGLGGSSAVNYCVYDIGPKDDFEEIARLTGDDEWKWVNAKERFKRLESYARGSYPTVPGDYKKYLDPKPENHGTSGPLKIGFPQVWEPQLLTMMDMYISAGHPANLDTNSGDPIGISVCPNTASKGLRCTSADFLVDAPSNLTILTSTTVAKVLLSPSDKTATGILTTSGEAYTARHETILSAGSLDTPKILMHSGIGDPDQLAKFSIQCHHPLPFIGANLRDHFFGFLKWERAEHTSARRAYYNDPDQQARAREQWAVDGTGPLAEFGCMLGFAFLRDPAVLSSPEFAALPPPRRAHLNKPTVPTTELIFNGANPEFFIAPATTPTMATVAVFVLNTESRGSVSLRSSDVNEPLAFDPNFFVEAWDRRVAVEAVRGVLRTVERDEKWKGETVRGLSVPRSESEEDVEAWWRGNVTSGYHMSGTVKMAEGEEDPEGCVDKDFRVLGLKGLRVVDMSVLPVMVNNHTQTTAYLVGLMAGDRLVEEYGLDA